MPCEFRFAQECSLNSLYLANGAYKSGEVYRSRCMAHRLSGTQVLSRAHLTDQASFRSQIGFSL